MNVHLLGIVPVLFAIDAVRKREPLSPLAGIGAALAIAMVLLSFSG
jgi:drug/metabolite transporter (DMT)-like permease